MGAYRLRMEIDVRHGYYADEACPGLRFVPTLSTQALLRRIGAASLATAHGIALMQDEDEINAPSPTPADPSESLSWLLQAPSSGFSECTASLGRPRQELLVFDAAQAVADGPQGSLRLHALEWASAQELHRWASIGSVDQHAASNASLMTWGRVQVPLSLLCHPIEANPARFVIRLSPRATVWKYCLIGDWPEPELHVIALAGEALFEPEASCQLADGRTARVFRSTAPIALREQPGERFQLRSRPSPAATVAREGLADGADRAPSEVLIDPPAASRRTRPEKVIVQRLPAAAPRHFSSEVIGGVPTLVSEIFVHR